MIKKILYKFWILYREHLFRKKIKKIAAIVKIIPVAKSFEHGYLLKWDWAIRKPSLFYPRVFSKINGLSSSDYVPENIYYNRIEPVLNNKCFSTAYSDKNFYEAYLPDFKNIFPVALLRGINGNYYDKNYRAVVLPDHINSVLKSQAEYILKPSIETSGGANLAVIARNEDLIHLNNSELTTDQFVKLLKTWYKGSFVLQERIEQHSWFAGFNDTSVNTVRMFIYRSVKDNVVHILQSVLRFGGKGSIVDNQAAGGLSCGISVSGILNDFAVDKQGRKYGDVDSIIRNKGKEVPGYGAMKRIASSVASSYYYHRLLGFDFCLDSHNNVRLLEINCKNIETNFLQMNNGPLFGMFTDEVIEFCKTGRRSVVFDFYI